MRKIVQPYILKQLDVSVRTAQTQLCPVLVEDILKWTTNGLVEDPAEWWGGLMSVKDYLRILQNNQVVRCLALKCHLSIFPWQ